MATARSISAAPAVSVSEVRPGLRTEQLPWRARVNGWLESLTRQLEHATMLSSAGKAIATPVAKFLPAGPVKDLLSGTWLGHPAHPLLTDVPIGAWTSAVLLDLVEIIRGSRGAERGE